MRHPHASATRGREAGLGPAAFLALASALPAPAQLTVYADSHQNGFADWSWETWNLAQAAVVHAGTAAISFAPGRTRANNSVMGLAGGVLSVLNRAASSQLHLILDVSGYFR